MNKMILFNEDIFKKFDEGIEVVDIHAKYVVFETARIFNLKAGLVELVFTVALYEEPKYIQISSIIKVDSVGTNVEEIFYMLPGDADRVLVSDGFEKFFIASHAIKLKNATEYSTNFYYYLLNKNPEAGVVYKLNLNNADQLLVSAVASLASKGHFVAQRSVADMMKWINCQNVVNLKYEPEDEFEIIDHHFTKVGRNKGVLSVIFDFNGFEGKYNKLFLLSINVTKTGTIFNKLKKQNHHKNKEAFIKSLEGARYEGVHLIQFDNDCINVDYINEDKFEKDAKPLTRSYFYTGDYIFNMLMHERGNLFERIVNKFL